MYTIEQVRRVVTLGAVCGATIGLLVGVFSALAMCILLVRP